MSPLKIATVFLLQSFLSAASFATSLDDIVNQGPHPIFALYSSDYDINDYENYFCDTEVSLIGFPAVAEAFVEEDKLYYLPTSYEVLLSTFKKNIQKAKGLVKQLNPTGGSCLDHNQQQALIKRFQQLELWRASWDQLQHQMIRYCLTSAEIAAISKVVENIKDRRFVEEHIEFMQEISCFMEEIPMFIML